MAVTIGQNMKM